ncbi:TetR-like C-terminal domain-containing protein [Aquipuribacter sp. MA13-6]|uniref:TetR-like C-terminal domain-containing protein n=1 Tax=unclassified Aquipuribacter TaxID=2635084 RepID=UPI003EE870A5
MGPATVTGAGAVLADEVGDAIGDAIQGRSGSEALTAAAQAMRTYVTDHPGRYAAGNGAHPAGPDDPLVAASERLLAGLSAALRGYRLPAEEEIHALRMLRSTIQGFATLEADGGFRIAVDVDESFAWVIGRLDAGPADRSAGR